MKWRWLFFDYVDPQLNLSREERRRVRRLAWKTRNLREVPAPRLGRRSLLMRLTGGRPFRWVDLMSALVPSTAMLLVLLPRFLPMHFTVSIIPTLVVQMTVTWILIALLGRISWKPKVNSALRQLGYDVCRRCGYWLRGLSDAVDRCPECAVTLGKSSPCRLPDSGSSLPSCCSTRRQTNARPLRLPKRAVEHSRVYIMDH